MNTRDERVLMNTVAGRVDHVHARVGNEERPQLALPFSDVAVDWHVAFWRKCWAAGARTACVCRPRQVGPFWTCSCHICRARCQPRGCAGLSLSAALAGCVAAR